MLAINSGSSSLKFAAFDGETCTLRGQARDLDEVLQRVPRFEAVGHRLVHGGPKHDHPTLVDDALLEDLDAAIEYAPLHLPAELAAIYKLRARFRDIPQVVCFDTGFHATLPQLARTFAIPRVNGVRRYGFHGLSYEYIASVLTPAQQRRAVFAHLGSGASLVAVRDGQSVDTTMGLTPAGGIVMGTRPGDLDPGVILYLLAHGHDAKSLDKLINHDSGLFAIAGTSDMHQLLAARTTDPRAALAVDLFCYSVKKAIGSFAAVLGGIDTLVFTGGIGEHAAAISQQICSGLDFLRIQEVLTIPTDEELVIARATRRVVTRL
jgi:acetate kinase